MILPPTPDSEALSVLSPGRYPTIHSTQLIFFIINTTIIGSFTMTSETLHTSYEYSVGLTKIPKDKLEALGFAAIRAKEVAYCKSLILLIVMYPTIS